MALHKISIKEIEKLFKKKSNYSIPKEIVIKDGYLTSKKEYETLAILCSLQNSETIFEIGTFEGFSTFIMAMNSPRATIYTLDLPKKNTKTKFEIGKLNKPYIGFKGKLKFANTEYIPRITCLYGDSATFDFSPFKNKIDFVFVDGAHTYEYTKNDTEKAFSVNKKKGIIVWHDYNPSY